MTKACRAGRGIMEMDSWLAQGWALEIVTSWQSRATVQERAEHAGGRIMGARLKHRSVARPAKPCMGKGFSQLELTGLVNGGELEVSMVETVHAGVHGTACSGCVRWSATVQKICPLVRSCLGARFQLAKLVGPGPS